MRTSKTPVTVADKLKVIFQKKKFLAELCEDFGEPEGVATHLKKIASTPLLSFLLKEDIKEYEKEACKWAEAEFQNYLERMEESEYEESIYI